MAPKKKKSSTIVAPTDDSFVEDVSGDIGTEERAAESFAPEVAPEPEKPKIGRAERLAKVMVECQKKFGAAIVTTADKMHSYTDRWLTGSLTLDYLLGGGLPRAKAIQFKGQDSSGKTSAATILAASVINQGGTVAWLKGEDMDRIWIRRLGLALPPNAAETASSQVLDKIIDITGGGFIEPHQFLVIEGQTGEELLESATRIFRTGALDLLIVDSMSSITPTSILGKGMDESEMRAMKPGLYARFVDRIYAAMGMHFDPSTGELSRSTNAVRNPITVVWTNQLRDRIGSRVPLPPEATGGWSLRYLKRADVSFKSAYVSDGETKLVFGAEVTMTTSHCQIAPPGRRGSFLLYTEEYEGHRPGQIDRDLELVNLAMQLGCIKPSGSWIKVGDYKFQGKDKFSAALKSDPILRNQLEAEVRSKF